MNRAENAEQEVKIAGGGLGNDQCNILNEVRGVFGSNYDTRLKAC